jgi:histidinol-phosphate aminotransferase
VNPRIEALRNAVRREVRGLAPYEAEPPGPAVRLDANESPFDIPESLKQEVLAGLRTLPWNRYPDPLATELRTVLAQQEGVGPEQIVVGNGSDEIIRDLLAAFGGPGTRTVFPVPTFSMYRQLTLATGGAPVGVPLFADWSLDVAGMLRELSVPESRVAFIASPNNPTGNSFPSEAIETLLRDTDRLVIVDEAYRLFYGGSLRGQLGTYPNLAILNTFSKSMSLAGVRIGYLIAHPEVVDAVNRVRLPYNLDAVAQYIAVRAAARPDLWATQAEEVKSERERVARALAALPGLTVYPSQANFLLVRSAEAGRLKRELAAGGVAVRGFGEAEGLNGCLRVTIGRPQENDRFLDLCKKSLIPGKR